MTNSTSDVFFFDRPCGSGKTRDMLAILQDMPGQPYLIVLPTLDECARYTDALGPHVEVPSPSSTKREHLLHLLRQGKTIVTTHALFDLMNKEHYYFLKDYVVVIDEAVEVVKPVNGGPVKGFHEVYVDNGYARIEDDGMVTVLPKWHAEMDLASDVLSRELYNLAMRKRLWKAVDTGFWSNQLPLEAFTQPMKVLVLTYLHQYSYLALFLEHKGIPFKARINADQERFFREFCRDHIEVTRGSSAYLEGCNWSATASKKITPAKASKIKAALKDVRRRDIGSAPASEVIWSTLKIAKEVIGGKRGKTTEENFVSRSTKGTNQYDQASVGLYLNSIHMHPTIAGFYHASERFKDGYALSEMLQWIFRMRCRRYMTQGNAGLEAIKCKVVVPCKHMRDLWERFINGDL